MSGYLPRIERGVAGVAVTAITAQSAATCGLVFEPGGPGGVNVYTVWSDLVAAIAALGSESPVTIWFSGAYVNPVVIPAGDWTLTSPTVWRQTDLSVAVDIELSDGVRFFGSGGKQPIHEIAEIGIVHCLADSAGSGLIPITMGADDTLIIDRATSLQSDVDLPMIVVADGVNVTLPLLLAASLGTGTTPVLRLGAASLVDLVMAGGAAELQSDTIEGPADASVNVIVAAAVTTASTSHAAFLGSISLSRAADAEFHAYYPATPSDWSEVIPAPPSDVADALDALAARPVPLVMTKTVYVSNAGDDVLGDGTVASPWATVMHAFRKMPREWVSTNGGPVGYVIRVVAPYIGPLGQLILPEPHSFGTPGSGAPAPQIKRITVQSWVSSGIGSLTDGRFTLIAGPLLPASVAIFGGRPRYTMAPATILFDDQWVGELVRIYQAGVEVSRGIVVRTSSLTQELLIQQGASYVALAADEIYIVRPSVQLGGIPPANTATFSAITGVTGSAELNVRFETIRTIDAIRLTQCFVASQGSQHVANGGNGAFTEGTLAGRISMSRVVSIDSLDSSAIAGGSVIIRGAASGFAAAGDVFVQAGCAFLGHYTPANSGGTGSLSLTGACTWRDRIILTDRVRGIVTISGGSAASPTLLLHRNGTVIDVGQGAIVRLAGVIAVDAAAANGNVVTARDGVVTSFGSSTAMAQFVPADAAVPTMAVGIVAEALRDALVRVNMTSTLAGSGGVDVKAGGNVGLTWAGLDALPGDRDNDLAVLASISGV